MLRPFCASTPHANGGNAAHSKSVDPHSESFGWFDIAPTQLSPFQPFRTWFRRRLHERNIGLQRRARPLLENPAGILRLDASFVIAHLLQQKSPLTFVQVGAYDGAENDLLNFYIKRGMLRGVMVEPQPQAFSALRTNYAGIDGLQFENAAIAASDGIARLYRVREEFADLCPRSRQMAAFHPDVILRHYAGRVADPTQVLEVTEVPTVTFPTLLSRHGIETVDLLQIDTEGFDYQVLRLFDFTRIRPSIVNFERVHLSTADQIRAYELLFSHDYLLEEHGWDCVAYQRGVRNRLGSQ